MLLTLFQQYHQFDPVDQVFSNYVKSVSSFTCQIAQIFSEGKWKYWKVRS